LFLGKSSRWTSSSPNFFRGVLHMHPSSTFHPPFIIKKIDFKQKRWTKGG